MRDTDIFENDILKSPLGDIKKIDHICDTYSAKVYKVDLYGKELVMKLLTGIDEKHKKRFLAEYVNLSTSSLDNYIIRSFFYNEVNIGEKKFPYTLMPLCDCNLKDFITTIKDKENTFAIFQNFLLNSVEDLHNHGIIHRDLKPENILIKDQRFWLADFGIAHYSPDAPLHNLTVPGERLANYQFSPREQYIEHRPAHPTMDIYAIGQLFLWFITGSTSTGAPTFAIPQTYPSYLYELIIKCIKDTPEERFQSIQEIKKFISEKRNQYARSMEIKSYTDSLDNFLLMLLSIHSELEESQLFKVSDTNSACEDMVECFKKGGQKIRFVKYNYDIINGLGQPGDNIVSKMDYNNGLLNINGHVFPVDNIYIYRDPSRSKSFIYIKGRPHPLSRSKPGLAIVDKKYEISLTEANNGFARFLGNEKQVDLRNHDVECLLYERNESCWLLGVDQSAVTFGENLDQNTKELISVCANYSWELEKIYEIIDNCDWKRSYIDELSM